MVDEDSNDEIEDEYSDDEAVEETDEVIEEASLALLGSSGEDEDAASAVQEPIAEACQARTMT